MKNIFLLLFSIVLNTITIEAQTFEKDGIYYKKTSDTTVEITKNPSCYTGNVNIPEQVIQDGITYTVTAVGDSAFYNCSSLDSCILPATIKKIGGYAFYTDPQQKNKHLYLTILSEIAPTTEGVAIFNPKPEHIYIPCKGYASFYNSVGWKDYFTIQRENGFYQGVEGNIKKSRDTILCPGIQQFILYNSYTDETIIKEMLVTTSGYYLIENNTPPLYGCKITDSIYIHVNNEGSYNEEIHYLCQNIELHYVNAENGFDTIITTPGTYEFRFPHGACENIIRYMAISVGQVYKDTTIHSCKGQTVSIFDPDAEEYIHYTTDNQVTHTYKREILGCDSIVKYNIVFHDTINEILTTSVCQNNSYEWYHQGYADVYDSVSKTYKWQNTIDTTIFSNFIAGNFAYLYDSLKTYYHCNINKTLNITVNPTYDQTIKDTICEGEDYIDNNFNISYKNYNHVNSDTTITIQKQLKTYLTHCDSIVNLQLTILPRQYKQIDTVICEGGEYIDGYFNIVNITKDTILYTSTSNINTGCDSIFQLNITTIPSNRPDIIQNYKKYKYFYFTDFKDNYHWNFINSTVFNTWDIKKPEGYIKNKLFIFNDGYDSGELGTSTLSSVYTELSTTGEDSLYIAFKIRKGYNTLKVLLIHNDSIVNTDNLNQYKDMDALSISNYKNDEFIVAKIKNPNPNGKSKLMFLFVGNKQSNCTLIIDSLYLYSYDNIQVNATKHDTINICANTKYKFNDRDLDSEGIYFDTLQNQHGCDSIVMLTLNVYPEILDTINYKICKGESYDFYGRIFTENTFFDTIVLGDNGCGVKKHLNLTVGLSNDTTIYDTICSNQSYTFHEKIFTISTIYKDTLENTFGCDSIVTLNLLVKTISDTIIFDSINEGDKYNLNGKEYAKQGNYYDTVNNFLGCDSIIELRLVVHPNQKTELYENICEGEHYSENGFVNLSTDGVYIQNKKTYLGSDSTVYLYLTVNPNYNIIFYDTICHGTIYTKYNFNETTSGVYTQQLKTIDGCDSIVVLNLKELSVFDTSFDVNICSGSNFSFGNKNLTQSGNYSQTLKTTDGCDSIINLNLKVNDVYDTMIRANICFGTTYEDNGFKESNAGIYSLNLYTINGCDSIVRLELTTTSYVDTIVAVICEGETYTLNNFNKNVTGIYTDSLVSMWGCDSVITLNLIVNPAYKDTIDASICDNTRYQENNFDENTAGIYVQYLNSEYGCDSVVILRLSTLMSYEIPIEKSICEGQIYVDHGYKLTKSGKYLSDTLLTSNGCDSVFILDLYVNPTYNKYSKISICEGESYELFNYGVNKAGIYYDTVASVFGCDSAVTVEVEVFPIKRDTIYGNICSNQIYSEYGFYESVQGTYTDTLQSAYGCDSIVVLILDVKESIVEPTIYDTICKGLVYEFNDKELDKSGLYVDSLQTVYGCDSIVSLNLQVNTPFYDTIEATICEGQVYNKHNFNEREAGRYEQIFHNVGGCDSVRVLQLHVNSTYSDTIDAIICQGDIYDKFGFRVNKEGVYMHNNQTVLGCDSNIVLNLKVTDRFYDTIDAVICEGEVYEFNNFKEKITGTYNQSLQTKFGCDSIITLNLRVNKVYDDTIRTSIKEGDIYEKYNFYVSSAGNYTQYYKTIEGCDSLVTLSLLIDNDAKIWIPNAFIPRNNVNNLFCIIPENEEIQITSFQIYNRQGTLLFKTEDISQCWDGKYKGEFCEQEVYVYKVLYYKKSKPNIIKQMTGTFMLIH
ncbi:MAG: T9SS type B sorting domain-containing protein [Bacteroidales bacterium]